MNGAQGAAVEVVIVADSLFSPRRPRQARWHSFSRPEDPKTTHDIPAFPAALSSSPRFMLRWADNV